MPCVRAHPTQIYCTSLVFQGRIQQTPVSNNDTNQAGQHVLRVSNGTCWTVEQENTSLCDYDILYKGTRWRSWLRHCVTSRKVAVSIPDGVIGMCHWHNPSGRTMVLGLIRPLTEMSTRNISWVSWEVTLPTSYVECHEIWEPQPPGILRTCTVVALPFTFSKHMAASSLMGVTPALIFWLRSYFFNFSTLCI